MIQTGGGLPRCAERDFTLTEDVANIKRALEMKMVDPVPRMKLRIMSSAGSICRPVSNVKAKCHMPAQYLLASCDAAPLLYLLSLRLQRQFCPFSSGVLRGRADHRS